MSILTRLGSLKPWQRVGLYLSASHLLIWVIYLLWIHRLGHGITYFAPPDWNFFPNPALRLTPLYRNLHWPYEALNIPVHLSYKPLGDLLWRYYQGGIYDLPLSTAEVAINYSFHLVAFAVWWFLLGAILASLVKRAFTGDTSSPIDLKAAVYINRVFIRKLVYWFIFSFVVLVVSTVAADCLLWVTGGQDLLIPGILCSIISGVALWAVLGIPFLALEAWYQKRRLCVALRDIS